MPTVTVTSVIDGVTFEVIPLWKWNGETGTRVRPAGYEAPELHAYGGQAAKDKLSKLIYAGQVELRTAHKIDRDAWSARSISETRILRITFPSGSDRLEFQEERL